MKNKAKEEEAFTKTKENTKIMFKIRQEKKMQQVQTKKGRETSHSKLL